MCMLLNKPSTIDTLNLIIIKIEHSINKYINVYLWKINKNEYYFFRMDVYIKLLKRYERH